MKKAAFSIFFISIASFLFGHSFHIYFENTGDEDIYYSYAVQEQNAFWGTSTDNWEVKGWYLLRAGAYRQVFVAHTSTNVAFAFHKRGGYVRYQFSSGGRPALPGWHVGLQPFEYTLNSQSSPSSQLKHYIPASFSNKFEDPSVGGKKIYKKEIQIPSYQSDSVTPFVVKPKIDNTLRRLEELQAAGAFTPTEIKKRLPEDLSLRNKLEGSNFPFVAINAEKEREYQERVTERKAKEATREAEHAEFLAKRKREDTIFSTGLALSLIFLVIGIASMPFVERRAFLSKSLSFKLYFPASFMVSSLNFGQHFNDGSGLVWLLPGIFGSAMLSFIPLIIMSIIGFCAPRVLGCQTRKAAAALISWTGLILIILLIGSFSIMRSLD